MAFNSYMKHCRLYLNGKPFPAIVYSVASWAALLGIGRIKTKTIKGYICGLRSAHIDRGYSDYVAFDSPLLLRVIRGIKRRQGDDVTCERKAITRNVLLDVLSTFDISRRSGATLHAAFCLAFAGFLRAGEFTWEARDREDPDFTDWFVTRSSIRLFADKLEFDIPASKTDPFRKGVTLKIVAAGDAGCAVASLRNLFTVASALPKESLFDTGDGAFNKKRITDVLRLKLQSLGYGGHYASHSFRRGAATEARNAGVPEAMIMLLGRWKSDAYLRYIEINPVLVLQASRRHQGR
jgi:integrase